jgi:filamentous hemagglutinin family protein
MNHVFKLVWSFTRQVYVVASEISSGMSKTSGHIKLLAPVVTIASSLMAEGAIAAPPLPTQLPTGAAVAAGVATVSQSAAHLNVLQSSNRAIIDWQSFSVGKDASVTFTQPTPSAMVLNRVVGADASQIFGQISANGQVFLVNPSGVYFSPTSQVNVGAFVASTHGIADNDFMQAKNLFTRNGNTANVVNEGTISVDLGGYVALLAPEVRNNGLVIARQGAVVMAAAETITLNFGADNILNSVSTTVSVIDALVENRQAVRAPGGLIIMSAQAASSLRAGVVNNSGELQADGVVQQGGRVLLQASSAVVQSGSISVNAPVQSAADGGSVTVLADLQNPSSQLSFTGNISAQAGALGGAGGLVETSASQLNIGASALVRTQAVNGPQGQWLIDPTDLTIVSGNGALTDASIGAQTLATNLATTNVTISTASAGNESGDITVASAVAWDSGNSLTLNAHGNVRVNANITNTQGADVNLFADKAGTGVGTVVFGSGAQVSTSGAVNIRYNPSSNPTTQSPGANFTSYATGDDFSGSVTGGSSLKASMLVNNIYDLQNVDNNAGANFTLGKDIDGTGVTFTPIAFYGSLDGSATPTFDGNNKTISNLSIAQASDAVGLFGKVSHATVKDLTIDTAVIQNTASDGYNTSGSGILAGTLDHATVSNIVLNDIVITLGSGSGYSYIGGLAGWVSNTTLSDIGVTGTSSVIAEGNWSANAGIVGYLDQSTLSNSSSSAYVHGGSRSGGSVGLMNTGSVIDNVSSSGDVKAHYETAGGLVGEQRGGSILNSHATGDVTQQYAFGLSHGGLVGQGSVDALIDNSYATGSVSSATNNPGYVGGLVGDYAGTITNSYASGSVTGAIGVGGLVGRNLGSIEGSYATGQVSATQKAGGLVGINDATGLVSTSYVNSVATVTATGDYSGGLVGVNLGGVTESLVASTVVVNGVNFVGGLVGANGSFTDATASLTDSSTAAAVNATGNQIGGVAGVNLAGINNTNASGLVTVAANAFAVGGLVGANTGSISNSTANSASVVAGAGAAPVGVNIGLQGGMYTGPSSTGTAQVDGQAITSQDGYGYTDGMIRSFQELNYISYFPSKDFTLGVDIDGTGVTFTPIAFYGSLDGSATPTFDGNNKTISNLSIAQASDAVGLFGKVSHATVKDLTIDTAVIQNTASDGYNTSGSGILAGTLDHATVSNIVLNDIVITLGSGSGYSYIGGLAGWVSNTTLSDIGVTGTSSVIAEGNWSANAGIVGYLDQSTLSNSSSSAYVHGGSRSGGSVGLMNTGSVIDNVSSSGDVKAHYETAGGLVGEQRGGSILNSHATGDVTQQYAFGLSHGGLVGQGSVDALIDNSYATGSVSSATNNPGYVGGLVGDYAGTITNSYASGSVTGAIGVGGLVGRNLGSIEGSYATGQVSATQKAGGLVGINDTTGLVTGSFARGNATANDDVGGFVGSNEGLIKTSYATGTPTASSGRFVGGFLGNGSGTLSDNYWDTTTSLVSTGRGGSTQEGVTGLTTVQMKLDSDFSQNFKDSWNFNGNYPEFPLFVYVKAAPGLLGSSIYGDLPNFDYQIVSRDGSVLNSSDLVVGDLYFTTAAGGRFNNATSVGDYLLNYASGFSLTGYRFKPFKNPTAWTVTARPLNVLAESKSVIYGEADPALSYVTESVSVGRGLIEGDVLSGDLSRTVGTDVGSYAITQGSLANGNYAISYTGADLSITARPVTVVADTKSVIYGEADPALSYVAESVSVGRGLIDGDVLSGDLSRTVGTDVGSYAITQGSLANGNYAISYTGADLSITARPVTVVADSLDRPFGAENPELTYIVAVDENSMGLVGNETLSGVLEVKSDKQSPPGAVRITQGSLTNEQNKNYNITFVEGDLTVGPRPFFESIRSAVVLPVIRVVSVNAPAPVVSLVLESVMPSIPAASAPTGASQVSPAPAPEGAASLSSQGTASTQSAEGSSGNETAVSSSEKSGSDKDGDGKEEKK